MTLVFAVACIVVNSQGVAINFNGQKADSSAALDVTSNSKALLIPRTTSPLNVTRPANSAIVYKVNDINAVFPDSGFYFNAGTKNDPSWQKFVTSLNHQDYSWSRQGNSKTTIAEFIGTTDNNPLYFKINYSPAGMLGFSNLFFGNQAGMFTSGVGNAFYGIFSGVKNTTGQSNTYLGSYSGQGNNGDYNVCVGNRAGSRDSTDLYYNVKYNQNVFIGNYAGYNDSTGSKNVFIGCEAGVSNKVGSNNVCIGYGAGNYNQMDSNTFVGYEAGYYSQLGKYNTIFGYQAAKGAYVPSFTSGFNNVIMGFQSGYINRGDNNVFVGNRAGYNNSGGSLNLAIGNSSLLSCTDGSKNTAIGNWADVAAGNSNSTVIGYRSYAEQSNSIILGSVNGKNGATTNTSVGIGNTAPQATLHVTRNPNGTPTMKIEGELYNSLFYAGTNQDTYINGGIDNSNIYIGNDGTGDVLLIPGQGRIGKTGIGVDAPEAKLHVRKGSETTPTVRFDGEQVNSLFYDGPNQNTYINGGMDLSNVYVGSQGKGKVIIGNQGDVIVAPAGGKVGIGTDAPTATLTVNGDAEKPGGGAWGNYSDMRVKKNINNYTKGLKEILSIHPISYQYNGKGQTMDNGVTYIGVIAQEMEKILPTTVSIKGTNDFPDQRYYDGSELTYTLINAIKEQQSQIEEIKKQNELLKAEIELLKKN